MSKLVLTLFVLGQSAKSRAAVHHLNELCAGLPADGYELEVIDVLEQPEAAELDNIIAVPVLMKRGPGPRVRIVGDLSDTRAVRLALGMETEGGSSDT